MQRCGFCHVVSRMLRRAMCVGSRRGSSESYYRELGDQETLKIEDKASELSDDADAEEETCLCRRGETPRVSPRSSPRASPRPSPRTSRQASPRTSPRPSRRASSLNTSPRQSRQASPQTSPRHSRKASTRQSRKTSSQSSPRGSRQTTRKSSPRPYRQASLSDNKTHPKASTSRAPEQTLEPHSGPSGLQTMKTSPPPSQGPSRCTPEKTPESSPISSRRTSPYPSRRSSLDYLNILKNTWQSYTKGSRLVHLHSDVATDSMEEDDPENYVMRIKPPPLNRFLTVHKRRKKKLETDSLEIYYALLDDLLLGQVQCILDQSTLWRFNAFTLETVSGGRCLPVLCVHLFQHYGLLAHFKLDPTKLWKLFTIIEEGYHSSNPYHNSIHAADVTQAMHCFLQQDRIRQHMTPLEIMTSLLAAIAHDLDHPGVNQPFLIATSNHLAALYENTSVLENHHWRSAMSCVIESGVLDNMPAIPGLLQTMEQHISSLILATDITRQAEYLSTFKNHLDMNTLDLTRSEHRHLVLQIALKCADISNPCRPWEISRKWSLKVCEEFFRQGDYERRLNLPVTALCDRHTMSIPKIQTGFFKYVVTPLISEWHKFLNNELSTQMLRNLLVNQNKWELLIDNESSEEKTETSEADVSALDEDVPADNDSRRLLLPPRRASLNPPVKKSQLHQLRRFSVPLNVFQDVRYRHRQLRKKSHPFTEETVTEEGARGQPSADGSQPSLHSQLSVRGHCSHSKEPDDQLNANVLLPDSTIASITTPAQAQRLNTVLREGGNVNKLVRQNTFPPLESASRDISPPRRPQVPGNEDIVLTRLIADFRSVPSTSRRDPQYTYLVVRDVRKTDSGDSSETSVEMNEPPRKLEKENTGKKSSRKETSTVGSQLRDNLSWMPLELDSGPLLPHRRKSMPTEVLPLVPKEKKMREVPTVVPQFIRRTFSGKEPWTKRRGSAPSPVAPSELRNLASVGSLRHSVNGSRKKPSLSVTCQQWLAKASYSVQERAQFPRRSSLPVEVMTGISTH